MERAKTFCKLFVNDRDIKNASEITFRGGIKFSETVKREQLNISLKNISTRFYDFTPKPNSFYLMWDF